MSLKATQVLKYFPKEHYQRVKQVGLRPGLTFCRSCRLRQLTAASIVSANCSTKLVKGQRVLSWESIRMYMAIELHAKGMTLDLKVDLPFFTIMLLKSWCPPPPPPPPIPSRFRYLKKEIMHRFYVLCTFHGYAPLMSS